MTYRPQKTRGVFFCFNTSGTSQRHRLPRARAREPNPVGRIRNVRQLVRTVSIAVVRPSAPAVSPLCTALVLCQQPSPTAPPTTPPSTPTPSPTTPPSPSPPSPEPICFALLKATTGATKAATTEARRRAIARTPQSRHRVTLAYTIHIIPPHTTLRNAPFSVLRVGAIMRGPWTGICIVHAAIRGGDRPSTKTRGGNAFCARVADRLAASRSWIVNHFASRPSSRARCSDPTSCA